CRKIPESCLVSGAQSFSPPIQDSSKFSENHEGLSDDHKGYERSILAALSGWTSAKWSSLCPSLNLAQMNNPRALEMEELQD
ncbi:hypothetical protein STEG23_019370, partial [Scotinomys teguina]